MRPKHAAQLRTALATNRRAAFPTLAVGAHDGLKAAGTSCFGKGIRAIMGGVLSGTLALCFVCAAVAQEKQAQADQALILETAGLAAQARGDWGRAFERYQEAWAALGPDSTEELEARLREQLLTAAGRLKHAPVVPEEARRHFLRASAMIKNASGETDFRWAVDEYQEALRLAPWWADAYFNMASILEKIGEPQEAMRGLRHYLLAKPKAADADRVKMKIIELEVLAEKQAASPAAKAKSGARIKWVKIPGGSFMMGSDNGSSNERPVHRVTVKAFLLAKTEVTNRQYRACVEAGACSAPDSYEGGDDHPVVHVDWERARKFSEWAGGRLPTEAEWEYAARGAGKDWKYPWGDEKATCERAVIRGCGGGAAPVCSKSAGNTAQGLCDMAGNVWEWTQDWYHRSYKGAPTDGSAWESPAGSVRVIRGGSWYGGAALARSAYRSRLGPGDRYGDLGFRPAR